MRTALLLTVPMALSAADLTIDHVTVAGKDLKAMQSSLAAMGIRSEYGGPHNNRATEMALTSFPDGSYLELIAIQPQADPAAVAAHYWSKSMQNEGGPAAWAVRPADLAAEVKRLRAASIAVSSPVRAGRARPDGVRLEWETANVGPEPNGMFFPFMIRDFTPREQRAHPGGRPTTDAFTGVSRVVIAVRNLPAAMKRYREAYELAAPAEQTDAKFGARLASFPGTPVVLAAPINPQSWLAARLDRIGEGPCAFILRSAGGGKGSTSWLDADKLGWWLGIE